MSGVHSLDARRLLRGGVLLVWAGFLAFLWLSGEVSRYLGPRTYWVVVFGFIALGLAGLGHLVTARSAEPRRIDLREVAGMLVLLSPLLAIALVPNAGLGALAASRKSASGVGAGAAYAPAPESDDEISFIHIQYASESDEYAASAGIAEGLEVDLVGFVSASDGGNYELTRFYVSCCAADAIPYTASIQAGERATGYREDQWLHVRGRLVDAGGEWTVEPIMIGPVSAPDDPYLY